MHSLSTLLAGLASALMLASCGTAMSMQDPLVSSSKGVKLVFEQVCLPAVLDGQNFAALASARLMTPMAPASNGSGQPAQTFRLGLTGVTATRWEDGSCTVGAQIGDGKQLQAQTLAALHARGFVMSPGIAGHPAINHGSASAFCSAEPRPLVLGVTTPASAPAAKLAMIATLFRTGDQASSICSPS